MNKKLIHGYTFNHMYYNAKLCKVMNATEYHHGYKYNTGMNIDDNPFDPLHTKYGLYFTDYNNFHRYIDENSEYIREVIIPYDAQVYIDDTNTSKFRSNKIIIRTRTEIRKYNEWKIYLYCSKVLNDNLYCIRFIPEQNQTDTLCNYIIKHNANLYKYIINKTTKMTKKALLINPHIIEDIEQTADICKFVIKINPRMLLYVKNQTEDLILFAVSLNGCVLEYAKFQTNAICWKAIKQNKSAIQFVANQTYKMCKWVVTSNFNFETKVVDENGCMLQYIRNKTFKLCKYAYTQDPLSLEYIPAEYNIVNNKEKTYWFF